MTDHSETISPSSVTFESFMNAAGNAAHERGLTELRPTFRQDGGAEIHPALRGISFNFFTNPDSNVHGVAVNYEGTAPDAPWASKLTGKVFEDFTQAKSWLRSEAARLVAESETRGQRGATSKGVHDTLRY